MKTKLLYLSWLCLYILCAGLGMLTQRTPAGSVILTLIGLIFFIPGIVLLYDALRENNKKILLQIRILSLVSLILTMSLIVLNIVFVRASESVGVLLNDLLIVFSAPMYCCYWLFLGPFGWACLFVSSFPRMWKA